MRNQQSAANNQQLTAMLTMLVIIACAACTERDPNRFNDRLQAPKPRLTFYTGAPIEGIGLYDTDRTSHSIELYRGRIVVLEFWSTRCPDVKRTENARRHFVADCATSGVVYLAIDSNRDEDPAEIRRYLADHGSSYPVLVDWQSEVAARFNATRTPQVFVLDRDGVLRYMGSPLSPQQWALDGPQRADLLEAAVAALLAGRNPDPSATQPRGSPIRRYFGW